MLLNKILELAKEGYSVHIEPTAYEEELCIMLCTHDLQLYTRKNKMIPYFVLEKLGEDEIINILEEIKNDIERVIKKHDQT